MADQNQIPDPVIEDAKISDAPQTNTLPPSQETATVRRSRSIIPYIVGVIVLVVLAVSLLMLSGKQEDKNVKTSPSTADSTKITRDAELGARLDSLQAEFENFRSSTNEKLDSLTAPAWLRKLDKDASEGGAQ